MNHRKVLNGCLGNGYARNPLGRRRKRGEKRERKMAHGISKLRTMGPVPGIDGVERLQLRNAGVFHHSHQIQTGICDGAYPIGETDQRQHRTRRPDFGVSRARSFKRGKRKDNIADRARANEQSSTGGKTACPTTCPTSG